MREGLIWREEGLFYYKNDKRYHAGIVKDGDKIYYIGRGGRAVKGSHVVHSEMTNDLVKHGTYIFGEDYAMIEGSYIPPKKAPKTVKKKKRKRVKKEFVKSTKPRKLKVKELVAMFGCIAAVFAVVITIALLQAPKAPVTPSTTQPTAQATPQDHVILPQDGEEVYLCSDAVKEWQNGDMTLREAVDEGDPYRAFTVEYRLTGGDGEFRIGEQPDLSDAAVYAMAVSEEALTIDNLKVNTTYYYRVTYGDKVQSGSFKTAKGTRFIHMPGAQNTRDIGGYRTLDGKTVKQGMIIRGTELDGLVEPQYYLKGNAKSITDKLGFVYEMDLREKATFSGRYISRLGGHVQHRFYETAAYGEVFHEWYRQSVKDIFTDLADPTHYPMYLHCTYGADRTGTVVYLLQGLLNVSMEDMDKEYCLTAFAYEGYAQTEYMNALISGLEGYQGNTVQEKIVSFLTQEIGITHEQIESIRSILLED